MNIKKVTLADGVNLNIIDTDKSKLNGMLVSLFLPLDAKTVTTYSLLQRVLRRGTKSYPTTQLLSQRLSDLYAAGVGASTAKNGETLSLTFSISAFRSEFTFDNENVFEKTLSILGEMIFDPYLVNGLPDEKIVENEKHLLADAIKSQIDNKSSYAIKRCSTLMCADELFSISSAGYIDDLSKITPKDLSDALVFARDNAAIEIVFAGKADNENLVSLLKTTLPFSPRTSVIPQTFIKTDVDEVKTISENMDVTQGKLTLGFRSPITLNSPDYIKFALFNELFGGSSTSKLFMNVREKLSLCYYCQTIPEPHKGIFFVASGIEFENYEKAKTAVLNELENTKKGKITKLELENAKRSLINAYKEIEDSPSSLCMWYLSRIIVNRYDSPLDAANAVAAVTKEDVVAAAESIKLDTVYFLKGAE